MASQGQEQRWRQAVWYYVPSVFVMIGLLLAWQLAVDFWQVKEYILPSPRAALQTLSQSNYSGAPISSPRCTRCSAPSRSRRCWAWFSRW